MADEAKSEPEKSTAKQRANPPPAFNKLNFCAMQVDASGSDATQPAQ